MRALAVLPVLFTLFAQGQCTLSGSGNFNWVICGDPGSITVQLANGTPPYHIQTTSGILPDLDVQGHSSSLFELDFDWSGYYPAGDYSFWSVTDALGCTTQFSIQHQNALGGAVNLYRALNCTTGTAVTNMDLLTPACPSSTYSYSIYSQGAPVTSGQVSSLPLVGPNTYTLPPLPDGSYTLYLSEGFGQCGQFQLHDCWQPVEFTHVNLSAGDCGVNLRLRAALDGALPSGILMTDGLRTANLLPTLQPYTALGYTFVGSPITVSASPALLAVTGNNAIVDWVVVELRTSPTTVAYSKPALLQRDGDVIDADGSAYLNFPVTPGPFYIAIRHRNHLGVMTYSSAYLELDPAGTLIDLRLSSTFTYGLNARVLKGSVYCLWAGDATFNGQVKYTGTGNDRDAVLLRIGGTVPTNTESGYYTEDCNLDGVVKYTGTGNDRDIILQTIGGTVPTNTRNAQLP